MLLCAGGRDISRVTNEGYQVLGSVNGDAGLAASLELLGGRTGAKVGLCVRDSPEPSAATVALLVETGVARRLLFQVRDLSGFRQQVVGGDFPLPETLWLQIERRGGDVIGSIGADGTSWAEVARADIALPDEVFIGFAGTGRDLNSAVAFTPLTARFCDIALDLAPPPARFLRSDTNTDAIADLSDAVFTLGYLFLGGPAPTCLAAANANGDAAVDISDATYLLRHLFLGGSPPPAPFPACGPGDLAADAALGCEVMPPGCR